MNRMNNRKCVKYYMYWRIYSDWSTGGSSDRVNSCEVSVTYINDVTDGYHDVSAKLFADDIKLYTEINTLLSESNFQSHLDRIYIEFSWVHVYSPEKKKRLHSFKNNTVDQSSKKSISNINARYEITSSPYIHNVICCNNDRLKM